MKPLTRLTIPHDNYRGAQLHNDLNRTVEQTNQNFSEHQTLIDLQQKTLAAHTETIAGLLARIEALERAN